MEVRLPRVLRRTVTMKRIRAILGIGILAAGVWSCTSAPEKKDTSSTAVAATPASTENVEQVITGLEKDWTTAIVNKDTATLDKLLADKFVGTSPTAHTYSKTDAIDDLKNGTYVVTVMDLDELSVNVFGNTAIAFASQEEKSKYDGKDTSGHYHYTDVWVKTDGKWQAVASHGSRFDKPKPSEVKKK